MSKSKGGGRDDRRDRGPKESEGGKQGLSREDQQKLQRFRQDQGQEEVTGRG